MSHFIIRLKGDVENEVDKVAVTLFSRYSIKNDITTVKMYAVDKYCGGIIDYMYGSISEIVDVSYFK